MASACGGASSKGSSADPSVKPVNSGFCATNNNGEVICKISGEIGKDATLFVGGPNGTPVNYTLNSSGEVVMDLPPTVVGSNLDVCVMEGDGVCRSIGYVTVEPRPMDALPSNDSEGSRVSGSLSCQSTGCIEGEICGDDGVCHPGAVDATTTPPARQS